MRLSAFNQYLEDYPGRGQTLIHNTFSGAFVVLDKDELSALRGADQAARDGAAWVFPIDSDLSDPDVGIVVPSLEREEREFRAWFEARRVRRSLDVVVGINLACNFACTYCSQQDVLDGSVMKSGTSDATADWIAKRAADASVERVNLCFVGGEPLLHPGRIEYIAQGIREALSDTGIEVTYSITTNGYLLTEELAERLARSGLDHVKVTLDGDASTHCMSRVAKNGEDTFRRVFDGVIAASRQVRVTVNGNYQPSTVGGFRPLIAELAAAGLPRGSELSFTPALAGLGHAAEDTGLACSWGRSDLAHHVALHDAVIAAGFESSPLNAVGPCELHDLQSFAIGPTGVIYKCPGFLGQPSWAIGHVTSGLTERYEEMLALTPKSAPCDGCSDRPNCGGGCLAAAWIREGNTNGVNCERAYFDQVRPHALAREFAVAMGEDPAEAAARLPAPSTPSHRAIRSSSLRVLTQ